eukprot:856964-Prorocentrum_minimum.AAC.1
MDIGQARSYDNCAIPSNRHTEDEARPEDGSLWFPPLLWPRGSPGTPAAYRGDPNRPPVPLAMRGGPMGWKF